VHEFHAVALEARAGHEAIPLMFGIDAVHGHNNIVGASCIRTISAWARHTTPTWCGE